MGCMLNVKREERHHPYCCHSSGNQEEDGEVLSLGLVGGICVSEVARTKTLKFSGEMRGLRT